MREARLIAVGGALVVLAAAAGAQDSTRGVRIGLRYDPGSKPAVVLLPISGPLADSIRAILERDFDYSDRITVIHVLPEDGSILAGSTSGRASALNYPLFGKLGAAAVIQITPTRSGLHVAVHDVAKAGVASVRDYPLPRDEDSPEWRLAVHGVSDALQETLTGERGMAQSRIAFTRNKTVMVVDSDGHGETALPVLGEAMSPSWHPGGNAIAYSIYGPSSRIIMLDLRTMKARDFGAQRNTTRITPVFTPDGKSLVYGLAGEDGSMDLFQVPLEGEAFPRRITIGRGSRNWGPSFNPDGTRLAFGSDRLGHPEVHMMDSDGTNADIFTSFDFGDQNDRTSPDWAPDGRQIAFQSRIDGRYQIFTMSLRDRQPRQLTSEGENEDPSWSPDGRHLVFVSTRTGTRQLWILDTESGRLRQLTRAGGSQVPAWSPRLTGR